MKTDELKVRTSSMRRGSYVSYIGMDGNPVAENVVKNITEFQVRGI